MVRVHTHASHVVALTTPGPSALIGSARASAECADLNRILRCSALIGITLAPKDRLLQRLPQQLRLSKLILAFRQQLLSWCKAFRFLEEPDSPPEPVEEVIREPSSAQEAIEALLKEPEKPSIRACQLPPWEIRNQEAMRALWDALAQEPVAARWAKVECQPKPIHKRDYAMVPVSEDPDATGQAPHHNVPQRSSNSNPLRLWSEP